MAVVVTVGVVALVMRMVARLVARAVARAVVGWSLFFDSLLIGLHFSLTIILTVNVRLLRTSTLSLFDCNDRCNSTPIDYSSVLVCCYDTAIAS